MKNIKRHIHNILEVSSFNNLPGILFNSIIILLIVLNIAAVIIGTIESVQAQYSRYLHIFEVFSVIVFTIEYLLRLWVCNLDEKFKNILTGKLRFAFTPMAIIDLLAIMPFYLPAIIPFDLRFIRILRLMRIFRIFKLARYSDALKSLGNVFVSKKEELQITAFILVILLVISSSLMYYAEHEVQPDSFSSIPATMWWGVSTLTTVGYVDAYPQTSIGKLLGALICILGIGMFALPTGILGSAFIEEIRKRKAQTIRCPHCGKEFDNSNTEVDLI